MIAHGSCAKWLRKDNVKSIRLSPWHDQHTSNCGYEVPVVQFGRALEGTDRQANVSSIVAVRDPYFSEVYRVNQGFVKAKRPFGGRYLFR